MRKNLLKSLFFAIMIALMIIGNIMVFRSEYPMSVFVTLIACLVVLILFPYEKFFNNK